MVSHEYWIDIYPTNEFVYPWRIRITETRNYLVLEEIKVKSEEEVISKVKSYWDRYGREKVRFAEHVYSIGPNKLLESMVISSN